MSTITAILLLIFNHYSMFELNTLYSTSGICGYLRMHVYVPVVVGLCLRQDGKRGLMATFGMYVCMYVCDTHMWHMHWPPAAWVCSLDAHKWCYKRSQRHSTSFVNPTKWASWEHRPTHSAQACRVHVYRSLLWKALGVFHTVSLGRPVDGWGEKTVNDRSIELNSFLSFTHSFSHSSPTHPGKSSPELTVVCHWSFGKNVLLNSHQKQSILKFAPHVHIY